MENMVSKCINRYYENDEWIIDYGSTELITHKLECLENGVEGSQQPSIVISNKDAILLREKEVVCQLEKTRLKEFYIFQNSTATYFWPVAWKMS